MAMDRDGSSRKFVHRVHQLQLYSAFYFFWPVVLVKLCNWLAKKKENRQKEKKHTHTYETKKIATFTFRTKKKQIEKSCQKNLKKSIMKSSSVNLLTK